MKRISSHNQIKDGLDAKGPSLTAGLGKSQRSSSAETAVVPKRGRAKPKRERVDDQPLRSSKRIERARKRSKVLVELD